MWPDRHSNSLKRAICSGPLAAAAARLLGSKAVRLYQDCTFLKVRPPHSQVRLVNRVCRASRVVFALQELATGEWT